MNQDQIIKFLIENLDADAFVEAKRNGTSIMYLAGVASRWTGGNATQPTRVTGNTGNERRRPTPAVQQEAVQDLNEGAMETPAPNTRPQPAPRNNPVRNNQNQQQDRVRVSRL
jgi:hypothetical protein